MTAFDYDHSLEEDRFITLGCATTGRLLIVSQQTAMTEFESLAPEQPPDVNARTMKMAISPDEPGVPADEMRAEYDFQRMPGAVRGKYAERYSEQLRIVRLADDVASAFPDEASVNNALREYLRDHRPASSGA